MTINVLPRFLWTTVYVSWYFSGAAETMQLNYLISRINEIKTLWCCNWMTPDNTRLKLPILTGSLFGTIRRCTTLFCSACSSMPSAWHVPQDLSSATVISNHGQQCLTAKWKKNITSTVNWGLVGHQGPPRLGAFSWTSKRCGWLPLISQQTVTEMHNLVVHDNALLCRKSLTIQSDLGWQWLKANLALSVWTSKHTSKNMHYRLDLALQLLNGNALGSLDWDITRMMQFLAPSW